MELNEQVIFFEFTCCSTHIVQMATKQTETQNFFDMYNNLGDQRELIDREIKMLNSVQEGFDHCWTNQHTKVMKNLIFPCSPCLSRLNSSPIWRIFSRMSGKLGKSQSKSWGFELVCFT